MLWLAFQGYYFVDQSVPNNTMKRLSHYIYLALYNLDIIKIPVSNTSMRLERGFTYWSDAKADCESKGQHLLILDTEAKNNWFIDLIQNAGLYNSVLPQGIIRML